MRRLVGYYTYDLKPLPEGGFSVLAPAIPEVCTYGETLAEAHQMARDCDLVPLGKRPEDR